MPIGSPVILKEISVDATGQSSVTLVLTTGASVGDLVVVALAYGKAATPSSLSVSDAGSNTWHLDRRDDKTTNNTPHTALFSSVLTTALSAGNTITITPSETINYPIAAAYKVSGIASSSPLDQTNGGQGVSSSPSSGNVTTTQADEILWGAICSGAGRALTPGSGWTEVTDTGNTTKRLAVQYRIVSSTGTYVSDGTLAASADWTDSIATYKGAASGTTYTKANAATAALSAAVGRAVEFARGGLAISALSASGPSVLTSPRRAVVTWLAIEIPKAPGAATHEKAGKGASQLSASAARATTYVEAGAAASAISAAGARATAYTEAGAGTSALAASGARAATYTKTGTGASVLAASGARAAAYTEAGTGASALAGGMGDGAYPGAHPGETYPGIDYGRQKVSARTGLAALGASASGANVVGGGTTYSKAGAGATGLAASGTRATEHLRAGGGASEALASGTDVYEASETGAGIVGASGSGSDVHVASETGTGTVGASASGTDVHEASETGAGALGAAASGARAGEQARSGTGSSAASASGSREGEHLRAASASMGASASGARVVVHATSGTGSSRLVARADRAVVYSEDGSGRAALVAAGANDYSPAYTSLIPFDPPRAAGSSASSPSLGGFDPPGAAGSSTGTPGADNFDPPEAVLA